MPLDAQIPMMVKPPQVESPIDAYSNVLKLEGAIQSRDLNRERIKQEQLENQQKQRSIDAQNAFTQALQENMTIGEDGNPKVNYVGAIKRVTELGHGEQAINLGKMRKEDYTDAANQITAQLNQTEKKAKRVGDLAGLPPRVQNWKDPNEIDRARNGAIAAIDQGEKEGVIDPQTAATYRAQAANYDQGFQDHLDAMASQGETLARRYRVAGEAVKNLHDLTLGKSQEREAEAKATGEELGLAAQTAGPVSSSGQSAEQPAGAFETKLTPQEETQFQAWKAQYAPKDSGADYDLRGAFKAGLTPDPVTGHWPDTFKKPNHPTFSDQSQYAKDAPDKAGHWEGDKYVPPGQDDETQYQNFLAQQTPAAQRVIRAREPKYSEGVYDRIKKLGLTPNQQAAQDAREQRNEDSQTRLEQGQERLQQGWERLNRTTEEKPATRVQYANVEGKKQKSIADSKKQLDKELSTARAGKDTEAEDEAWKTHIERLQDAQSAYEAEVSTLSGKPLEHNPWADQLKPPSENAPPPTTKQNAPGIVDRVKAAVTGGKPQQAPSVKYTVGQKVKLRSGKVVTITSISGDQFEYE